MWVYFRIFVRKIYNKENPALKLCAAEIGHTEAVGLAGCWFILSVQENGRTVRMERRGLKKWISGMKF